MDTYNYFASLPDSSAYALGAGTASTHEGKDSQHNK